MAEGGCRPEVADRIVRLLMEESVLGEVLLDLPRRRARPAPPPPEKPARPPKPPAPPVPRAAPKPRPEPKPRPAPKARPAPARPAPARPAPKPRPAPRPRPNRAQELAAERDERRQQARALFVMGKSLGEVAEELGITAPTVAAYVSDMRQRRDRVATPEELEARRREAARLAGEGWSLEEIAAALGRSVSMIKVDLRACGVRAVPRRRPGSERFPESRSA